MNLISFCKSTKNSNTTDKHIKKAVSCGRTGERLHFPDAVLQAENKKICPNLIKQAKKILNKYGQINKKDILINEQIDI